MRIATYNLRKGGTRRCHWQKMLDEFKVELLLVQESYPPDQHLPPLLFPQGRDHSVWMPVVGNGWGSAVYCGSNPIIPVPVSGFDGWVAGAELSPTLLAFSIHAPPPYQQKVNEILDRIVELSAGRETIIGGDFNLVISPPHESDKPASKRDMAIQARLRDELRLVNCWKTAHPDRPLAQTLRWTRNRETAYHCDGLFVPAAWQERIKMCEVVTGWEELSDHNPVVAEIAELNSAEA